MVSNLKEKEKFDIFIFHNARDEEDFEKMLINHLNESENVLQIQSSQKSI